MRIVNREEFLTMKPGTVFHMMYGKDYSEAYVKRDDPARYIHNGLAEFRAAEVRPGRFIETILCLDDDDTVAIVSADDVRRLRDLLSESLRLSGGSEA